MPEVDNSLVLPPSEEIQSMEDVREWMRKVSGLLGFNQADVYEEFTKTIDNNTDQTIEGTKSFTSLKLTGNMDCNQKQMVSMVIENRTDAPDNPVEGQMYLDTTVV